MNGALFPKTASKAFQIKASTLFVLLQVEFLHSIENYGSTYARVNIRRIL